MQTQATFPTDFSHLPQALETLAVRCTRQLMDTDAGSDPDLFGKLQRNLAGILRSLANIEKRAAKTPSNPSGKSVPRQKPKPRKTTPTTGNPPQLPSIPTALGASVANPEPSFTPPTQPAERRLSKAERRAMRRAEIKARKKQLKEQSQKTNRVQTSEQDPAAPSLTHPEPDPPSPPPENSGNAAPSPGPGSCGYSPVYP